ncbi:recombinase family protein [Intestinimonas massiliensis (ex Afouda et al. 2020)]|uniref:recombinase family protein n=1 Tax=Intestinimonas massiliensis (ex Afouda et al. 2020) TaxID=1673721 RepID=UPI00102FF389|nr:recombinase family protein [Intestinimonas massiliensis (ex Afouda et al. 2020)]
MPEETRRIRVIPATKEETGRGGEAGGRKRVAAYCRVSTNSEEQINSYESQKSYYTEKIEKNPDWEMAGVFADKGLSGTSLKKRDQFNKMIAACRRGRIDLILTKSLSRFARNTVDCLETVRMLKANGIGVYFEKENINTLTESSEFLITLFSGFAQAESESLSKNVAWGKQKSAEAGNVPFQYKKTLGYRKGKDGKPEIVPEDAKTIRRIYQRYLDGCSLGQIKQELEEDQVPTAQGVHRWSYQVIQNILTNERYIGDVLLQKTYVTDCISKRVKKNQGERPMYYIENNHPAIIPREIYQAVQTEMTRRSSKRKVMQKTGKTEQGKYSYKYALSELLVCGECGTPYKRVTWARNGKKKIVWRCISRLEFGTKYCHTSPTIEERKLHAAILSAMNELADFAQVQRDAMMLAQSAQESQGTGGDSLLELRRRLQELSVEQESLLEQILDNMDDVELNARLKEVADEKQKVKNKIESLRQNEIYQAEREERLQAMWASIQEHAKGFQAYDDELTRLVVEKITVLDSNTIRIRFRDTDLEMDRTL